MIYYIPLNEKATVSICEKLESQFDDVQFNIHDKYEITCTDLLNNNEDYMIASLYYILDFLDIDAIGVFSEDET